MGPSWDLTVFILVILFFSPPTEKWHISKEFPSFATFDALCLSQTMYQS